LGGEVAEVRAVPYVDGVNRGCRGRSVKACSRRIRPASRLIVVEDALEFGLGGRKPSCVPKTLALTAKTVMWAPMRTRLASSEGVDVEGPAADGLRAGKKPERDEEADKKCDDAGDRGRASGG